MRKMWHWNLDLIFKAKLKLESRNQKKNPICSLSQSPETKKIPCGSQAAILKVRLLKINRLLQMATIGTWNLKFGQGYNKIYIILVIPIMIKSGCCHRTFHHHSWPVISIPGHCHYSSDKYSSLSSHWHPRMNILFHQYSWVGIIFPICLHYSSNQYPWALFTDTGCLHNQYGHYS